MRTGSKQFFFEKKNQKTFTQLGARSRPAHALIAKVFWFFFSKKNCFLTLPCLACVLLPTPSLGVQLALCVPAVAVLGLPHGATDWLLAGLLWRERYGRAWPVVFAALYGSLMLLVAGAAAAAPVMTLLVFLVVAAWHFGTEDAAALGLGGSAAAVFVCGVPVVAGPALFWPHQYGAVLALMGVLPSGGDVGAVCVAAAVAMAAWALVSVPTLRVANWRVVAELGALLALQAAAPPLVSFSVYFCLVHGPRHMAGLPAEARGWQMAPVSVLAVIIITASVWFGSDGAAGAGGLAACLGWAGANGLVWGLACLTLPHVALGYLARRLRAPAADGMQTAVFWRAQAPAVAEGS
jgi:Brp/Blh family beta-carotene 15,15'-monooxygenase